jgi:hypothetical protein
MAPSTDTKLENHLTVVAILSDCRREQQRYHCEEAERLLWVDGRDSDVVDRQVPQQNIPHAACISISPEVTATLVADELVVAAQVVLHVIAGSACLGRARLLADDHTVPGMQ